MSYGFMDTSEGREFAEYTVPALTEKIDELTKKTEKLNDTLDSIIGVVKELTDRLGHQNGNTIECEYDDLDK